MRTTLPNLPTAVASEILGTLCALLPPPAAGTPEAHAAREEAAMAAVAALHPADAFEAQLAAQIVAADAHTKECLRLAVQPGQHPQEIRRHRSEAVTMMRQMQGALRILQRRQAAQEKGEAAMNPVEMERAGYWFRDVSLPPPELAPAPDAASEPEPSPLTDAEQYAAIYPDRAARIRAAGGLPAQLDFGPPEPAIVEALVNGTSPILLALDRHRLATRSA
jgi:hypothetical protein